MLRKTLLAVGLSIWCAAAVAATEGTDYVKLDTPLVGTQGTLVKVFSYDCSFCYKYDRAVDAKIVPSLTKDTGLTFAPVHLAAKAKYGEAASDFFALCLTKDKDANLTTEAPASCFHKAKNAVYNAYHRERERWGAGEAAFVKTLTDATGVTAEEFAAARQTKEVRTLADSWKGAADVAHIQGIPAYVVNGKYLILNKRIRSADGMASLVKELSTLK